MKHNKITGLLVITAIVICIISAVCIFAKPWQEADNPCSDQQNVFGQHYNATEIVYQDVRKSHGYTSEHIKPAFFISLDGVIAMREYPVSYVGKDDEVWKQMGKLTDAQLAKENFDDYFLSDGWSSETKAEEIRKMNLCAWEYIHPQSAGYSCYILQQNNGDIYSVLWYADPERINDIHSDDSNIVAMFRLEPAIEAEDGVIFPKTSYAAITDENGEIVHDFSDSDVYIFNESVENIMKPSIMLSNTDNSFQFVFSMYSSYISIGTYELTEETLTLSDGDKKFVFEVQGDTFVFRQDISYPIPKYRYSANSYQAQSPVPDGAVFERLLIEEIDLQEIQ